MKKIFTLIISVLFAHSMWAESTELIILENLVGAEKSYYYGQVGRIIFTPGEVQLLSLQGELLGKENRNDIQKIVFRTKTGTDVENIQESSIKVYASASELIVEGAADDTSVRVFTVDGKLIMTSRVKNGQAFLSVEHLATGTYLLQIHTQIVKFIKR